MIDPAVFQKTSYDTAHTDAVAQTSNARTEPTDPPHNQISLNTGLRRIIKSPNNIFVEQRIHFGDDTGWSACARVFGLALDQSHALFGEIQGRYQQWTIIGVLSI